MTNKNLADLAEMMKDLDLCMMSTKIDDRIASRPMSNNREVQYDGNSYFFTNGNSDLVKELKKDPSVNLSFEGKHKFFMSVEGTAILIIDKNTMEEHWSKELNLWFPEGLDTQGITMIQVIANRIRYWYKMEMGVITL